MQYSTGWVVNRIHVVIAGDGEHDTGLIFDDLHDVEAVVEPAQAHPGAVVVERHGLPDEGGAVGDRVDRPLLAACMPAFLGVRCPLVGPAFGAVTKEHGVGAGPAADVAVRVGRRRPERGHVIGDW